MGSPLSPIVVNLYMEDLEHNIIATAPEDCQQRSWKRYVGDVTCLVHTVKAEKLQQHMNTVDPTNEMKKTTVRPSWMPSSPERKMEA